MKGKGVYINIIIINRGKREGKFWGNRPASAVLLRKIHVTGGLC